MKQQIQKFGRALSAMVMPNIGAFIAWGLITAIFIPGGWWPNDSLANLVSPMLKFLLPLLIAYTAGRNVGDVRGGVTAAVATMGVIVGTDTPMFLGAMIMGPFAGWCIKKFDSLIKGKVGAGFEMLVDNFSLGIIAMILAIGGYLIVGHMISAITLFLTGCVNWMLSHKMNPLLALIVDPAKVLFLNNAVNHGIMTPLGIQQAAEFGHSMLFLVDPNPGPGLGVLLACWAFGKGTTKQSAPGAVIIQLFGGIHEIYFPYVLARPALLLPVIAGNVCALSFYTLVDFGLVAPASPGSIISIILMSPRGKVLFGIIGVALATAVSFLLSCPFIRRRPDFQGDDEVSDSVTGDVKKIVFACDSGMGSSALGATRFTSRLQKAGVEGVVCMNCAVGEIPSDASLVICQKELAERASLSGKHVIAIANFLEDPALDALLGRLSNVPELLSADNVLTCLPSESCEEAIRRCGGILVKGGYVDDSYVEAMLRREKVASTCMGMGLAIPHGTEDAKAGVKHSGIAVLQYPDGVEFADGEIVHLVVGIAGVGDDHLDILAKLSAALEDPEVLARLCSCKDSEEILKTLS